MISPPNNKDSETTPRRNLHQAWKAPWTGWTLHPSGEPYSTTSTPMASSTRSPPIMTHPVALTLQPSQSQVYQVHSSNYDCDCARQTPKVWRGFDYYWHGFNVEISMNLFDDYFWPKVWCGFDYFWHGFNVGISMNLFDDYFWPFYEIKLSKVAHCLTVTMIIFGLSSKTLIIFGLSYENTFRWMVHHPFRCLQIPPKLVHLLQQLIQTWPLLAKCCLSIPTCPPAQQMS